MNLATPRTRAIAKRLLEHGVRGLAAEGSGRPAAFLVVGELRPHLANLMGSAGFRALLSRSLAVARTEKPWLRSVTVNDDGSLGGLDALGEEVGRDEFLDGNLALLAQLLTLLVTFIGETLTLRLMRNVWPDVSLTDPDSGTGDTK